MKDKRILTGQMAYAFKKHEDGIEMYDCRGFTTCAEDIMELCYGLMTYAFKHKSEIDIYNQKHMIEFEKELNGCRKTADKESKTESYKNGYVYLLECGGKYKIGFSKDVERRIHQLDTRPFKLNLIVKSKFISDAYDREQELHEYFADKKVDREWYEFSDHEAQYAKEIIEELEEDC
jgi:predicted GIY-YIG superfamily endonuclease